MRRGTALALVVASAACFGTLAVLGALAYRYGARPLPLLAWRFAIATVVMGGYVAIRRPGALVAARADLGRFVLLSVAGYGAASMCFFFALGHASAAVVTVLLYTYPALVALYETLAGRSKLSWTTVAGVIMTFAGCALVVGLLDAEIHVDAVGTILGLGAGVGYASFTVMSGRLVGGHSRLVVMTFLFGVSAVVIGCVSLLAGESLSPAAWTPALWAVLALLVVIPTIAAVALYMGGIRRLGASRAAIASTTEPLFTIALAWMLLGDRLTFVQAIGALLVVAGVMLAERFGAGASETVLPA
ncbi:MAG: EamA-like transporter family protein [Actinobacteria bacterium 66_15]|nr:MAG: EamA-like transporter family protein [Actinobacteria bacterium 66_15]